MIKIAHEAPLSIMKFVREKTDFCYALVHLFDTYPEYKEYFRESLRMGRTVFLDNSVFELGESFEMEKFYKEVCDLQPTAYIIPDALEDSQRTIKNIKEWCTTYGKDAPGLKIGVVQGKTLEELVECYRVVDEFCDIVAISFNYSYYLTTVPEFAGTVEERYGQGRVKFIQSLIRLGVINYNKPVHLLGVFVPQEMLSYVGYKFIQSVDTSNPIVHAIKNIKYSLWGLRTKERVKMCDMMETPFESIDQEILTYNIDLFREFCS